jgi:hypothetical protein
MTVRETEPSDRVRPRSLQEGLLQDLLQTAPMADPRPAAVRARQRRTPAPEAAQRTPPVELRVTPTRWRAPGLRPASGGQGLVLSAGPLRVSVGLPPGLFNR